MKTEKEFWSATAKDENGCLLWTRSKTHNGYAQVRWDDTMRTGHRVAYELTFGAIPEGLQVDHLCRVRHCVNPDHLELVTHQENIRRGASNWNEATGGKCKRGHDITNPDNVYTAPGGTKRQCRECVRLNNAEKTRQKRLVSPYPAVRKRA